MTQTFMELKNNEQCSHCGRFANRGVSIDAIIVKDDSILLIKRGANPFKDYWALPGGYVEWDESAEDAVKREVKEELGLSVSKVSLVGAYSNPSRHPKQVINLAYSVEASGQPRPGDDAAGLAWYKLNELPADLAFDHKLIIEEFLNKNGKAKS
ncbi:NUDIX hydrolase [Candidatus Falkowbacteria bacterium]|nr:NUDIX hydrolase [Candidatus Falkowbacteria bacterium]